MRAYKLLTPSLYVWSLNKGLKVQFDLEMSDSNNLQVKLLLGHDHW